MCVSWYCTIALGLILLSLLNEELGKNFARVIVLQWDPEHPLFVMEASAQIALRLTHVVHDSGLGRLAVQIHNSVDAGRNVPGCRSLRHAVHEEVQAAVLLADHTHCVSSLKGVTVRLRAGIKKSGSAGQWLKRFSRNG